jgi:hypothetical protein
MRAWKYRVFMPQPMSLLAPLTKILPKSYQNLTISFPASPIFHWLGRVLKVEMMASARDFTSFTTEACELTQVAYRHIENTTETPWEASTRRVAVGSRRFGERFRVDTALQPCDVEGPCRAWRSCPATPCPSLGGTRRARAVRERGRMLQALSACMTRLRCERLTGQQRPP